MLLIGLTGGMGSGKTTVADLFAKYDTPIIDADVIARQCTQFGTEAYAQIIDHFGEDVRLPNGNLNREKLKDIIFKVPDERRWLEELLHPLISIKIMQQVKMKNAPYCIIVIPLLVESKSPIPFDRILVVDAPREMQIARVQNRDQLSLELIKTILDSQASTKERLAIAHDIINNDGNLEELTHKVKNLHEYYLKISPNAF